ncbi:MAG: WXG100 family type VII secretion target [Mycobacterium sp.]|uniref:WXG100 family type VII secretion target n=1 Tax=Mycobacterium sp. TaxID=1785 RepID=UPI001EC17227|nr:WXG100 family type VII secretion target [Mycobacterium sp.]MBW0016140.1 WXG100 family type VII secretion target [Mycobacterium sp.]
MRGGRLGVVPELVWGAAAAGRGQHEQLAAVYAATQSQAWDAEAGWVGRSASALSAMLDRWQSAAAAQHAMLNAHHDGLDAAAVTFVEMDRGACAQRLIHIDDTHVG